jgi:AcrR family transcriptional regulator
MFISSTSGGAMSRQSRREREKERIRIEILDTAEAVFAVHGFHNTTISMIAAAVELSVGSIYNFFPSKEVLFQSIMEIRSREGLGKLREAADALSCPLDKLRSVISMKVRFFIEHYGFFRIFMGVATASYRPQIEKDQPVIIQYHEYMDWIESIFQEAIALGKIKPFDARFLAVSVEGLTFGLIEHWDRLKDVSDTRKITDMIEEVFFSGILPQD